MKYLNKNLKQQLWHTNNLIMRFFHFTFVTSDFSTRILGARVGENNPLPVPDNVV